MIRSNDSKIVYFNTEDETSQNNEMAQETEESTSASNNVEQEAKASRSQEKKNPPKYRPEWNEDRKLKDWIEPLAGDEGSAYCKACAVTLKAYKSGLLYHATSQLHKKKMEASSDESESDAEPKHQVYKTISGCYEQKYKKGWEEHPELKGWLAKAKNNNELTAWCRVCSLVLRTHKHDLLKHARSKRHKKKVETYVPSGDSELLSKALEEAGVTEGEPFPMEYNSQDMLMDENSVFVRRGRGRPKQSSHLYGIKQTTDSPYISKSTLETINMHRNEHRVQMHLIEKQLYFLEKQHEEKIRMLQEQSSVVRLKMESQQLVTSKLQLEISQLQAASKLNVVTLNNL